MIVSDLKQRVDRYLLTSAPHVRERETYQLIDQQQAEIQYLQQKLEQRDELCHAVATEFYYHWHNSPGSNTQQGFEEWWKLNRVRFLPTPPSAEGE